MNTTLAFLIAVVIMLALMATVEPASQALQPLSEAIIGEPLCVQPDGSVCPDMP